jgi:hypothetical protein
MDVESGFGELPEDDKGKAPAQRWGMYVAPRALGSAADGTRQICHTLPPRPDTCPCTRGTDRSNPYVLSVTLGVLFLMLVGYMVLGSSKAPVPSPSAATPLLSPRPPPAHASPPEHASDAAVHADQPPVQKAPRATHAPGHGLHENQSGVDETEVWRLHNEVKAMKRAGTVMETDPAALALTGRLQNATRALLPKLFGAEPYRVEFTLRFPDTQEGRFTVQMAPAALMPHSVFLFLKLVSKWKRGAFHRNAGHVLQAMVTGGTGLAWQEYSSEYPHKIHTLGYAGRPGGPDFYVNIIDNKHNHGPGSQGSKTEADSCFAQIVAGLDTIERIKQLEVPKDGHGFFRDAKDHVVIVNARMTGPL